MPKRWMGMVLFLLATFVAIGNSHGEAVPTGDGRGGLPWPVGRSPMDIAYGVDYEPDPRQLARLRLDRPELIQYRGPIQLPGIDRLFAACDFQGNDVSTLYCLDRENSAPDDVTNLYAVDTETAELTRLASFPLTGEETNENLNGLTYDPTTGRMYAVSCAPFFGDESALYELDLQALSLTRIGEMSEGPCLAALGADNDGQLWALDVAENGRLVAIDKNSGSMVAVAALDVTFVFGAGLDFDGSDGTCYIFVFNEDTFSGELRRCDTDTGQTELVGVLGEENHGGGLWGTGAVSAPSPCHVTLELGAEEIQAGDPLPVQVGIVHNRAQTVAAPLRLSIEDAAGEVVMSRQATPTLKVGGRVDRGLMLRIPKTLPPGSYTAVLEVGEMEQGEVQLSKPFTVLAPANK